MTHAIPRNGATVSRTLCALGCVAVALSASSARARQTADGDRADDTFLLVTRDFKVQSVQLAAINDQSLVIMQDDRGWVTLDLKQCIALLNADGETPTHPARGMLLLADGQRLPGEAVVGAEPAPDTLVWNHPWLGRVDVPFKLISSVLLTPDAVAPAPGNADVVLLANGDRQEGFVTAIGDPVTIEVSTGGAAATSQALNIPLERVTAITMIAPRQTGKGRRIWFSEGTVLDVQSIAVGDDGYVRLGAGGLIGAGGAGAGGAGGAAVNPAAGPQPPRIPLTEVAGVLFDREAMIPLASIALSRVEGPATRYVIPRPSNSDPDAALGLSAIEYSGPIVARYALPAGCQRFIADAELPRDARTWGDCELVVRSDDEEIFRTHLSSATPVASINVPVKGRELTIEVAAGAHGPIQDLVRLHRPMLLKGK